ncbi:hypothetical protein ACFYZH_31765 [Streptomyces abikoensis]|uniref:hypothetical protein n=1 Tax=Streptomyces abikoensis TaxID=97398 RepID=UPI0036A92DB8
MLAFLRGEPGGRSELDGTPLFASVTTLARRVYAVEEPTDAQRASVRRALRRLEASGLVELRRMGVGRSYRQRRAHPRRAVPRYEQRLAACTGDGCEGCAAGDRASTYFTADVVAMFIDYFGTLPEADRELWRATARGWHLYSVPLPRPAEDYRTYPIEVTELCARRALSADEQERADQQLRDFLAPHVAAVRASRPRPDAPSN